MHRVRGVLLDIDGTLVDSNDAHAQAWASALEEFGHPVRVEQVRRLIGKGGDKLLPEVIGIEADSPEGKAISNRRGEIFQKDLLPRLNPFARARDLLTRMQQAGLRLGVASSARKGELEGLLHLCQADELIEASTSSDDAAHSKPDPDIVHAALERIGLPREETILLGDTPYDVEAGIRAGIGVVALRCGGWADEDLSGARAIFDDPADLLARFDESPFCAAASTR